MEVFLLLGSNLGEREVQLGSAITLIEKNVGPINKKSSIYSTKAWGKTDQPDFYNQAILIDTTMVPLDILDEIKKIEKRNRASIFCKMGS